MIRRRSLVCIVFAIFLIAPRVVLAHSLEDAFQAIERNEMGAESKFYQAINNAGTDSIGLLLGSASSSNGVIRRFAFIGLRMLKVPCVETSQVVKSGIRDADETVRFNALYYLSALNCADSKEDILGLLGKERDIDVLEMAINIVGAIGSASDMGLLKTIQDSSEKSLLVRCAAAGAIARLNGNYDGALLKMGLRSEDQKTLRTTLFAYGATGDIKAVDLITPFLSRPEPVKSFASISIVLIKMKGIDKTRAEKIDRLFSVLDFDSSFVRLWALDQLLGAYQDQEIVRRLRDMAASRSKARGEIAGKLLQKLDFRN
jgi:hypothetical protein